MKKRSYLKRRGKQKQDSDIYTIYVYGKHLNPFLISIQIESLLDFLLVTSGALINDDL